jgi:acyl-CoA hydrolase
MSEADAEPEHAGEKTPERSKTEMTELLLPQHANALGTAFGGTIMSWVDICGAIAAQRHCGRIAVTAFVDDLQFLAPIRVGDVVRLTGRVNAAFGTSLEVEVVVEREDAQTMKRTLCADALLTFVSIGDDGAPCAVPPLEPATEEDRRRASRAQARREERLAARRSRA